jgi:hypothetical protein
MNENQSDRVGWLRSDRLRSAVAGLPVIEVGILFVLIGALVGWFFSKQK